MTRDRTVLLNATSVVVGGGIQATVSFIRHVLANATGLRWRFALSAQVAAQLRDLGIDVRTLGGQVFNGAPARDCAARKQLKRLEQSVKPDLVFTFFGPAYVRFHAPHLCGVADPWVTHGTRLAYGSLGGVGVAARVFLQCMYKGLWFRQANRWLVEEQSAGHGLQRRYAVPAGRITVIANGCAEHYVDAMRVPALIPPNGKFRLLTFAAYYRHKHLEFIPDVAAELKRRGLGDGIEFVITVRPDEPALAAIHDTARVLGVSDMIRNVGPVAIKNGPGLYRSCDALFMPSLLETSSATYPEAMAMKLPIVTVDLGFARSVCGSAALYYSPKSAMAAADAVERLFTRGELREQVIEAGTQRLRQIPCAGTKNGAIVALLHEMMRDCARRTC